MAMEAKMAVSNACPDQEQIFKVIAGKLGKWSASGKRGEWGERGGAQGNVILFLTCLSLLNLLIEICMAKLLRTLMPAPCPPPAYTLPSVCWLSCTKFCALFCTATTTAMATTITWHTMFFLPLNFRPVEAPGQTLQQIKQQLQHPPPSPSSCCIIIIIIIVVIIIIIGYKSSSLLLSLRLVTVSA